MSDPRRETIDAFLAGRRIAFVGLSSQPGEFSRAVDRELTDAGYEVVPVNPHATAVDQRPAYPRVSAIPAAVDGALIMTPPEAARAVVEDCLTAGVRRVWLHRGVGPGAVSEAAVRFARDHGMAVVEGECPLMYLRTPALPHRAHALGKKLAGTYPYADAEARPKPLLTWGSAAAVFALDWVVYAASVVGGYPVFPFALAIGAVLTAGLVYFLESRGRLRPAAVAWRTALSALAVAAPLPLLGTLLGLSALVWDGILLRGEHKRAYRQA